MNIQPAVSGDGDESESNSSGISFNSQQSVERLNIANPGWSGHLQGQQSLNPSGQQSRHGNYNLAEQISANQNEIYLNFIKLQQQQMQLHMQQQQQQLKQQQMLQMQQHLPSRTPIKIDYKLGMGDERLMQYMYMQSNRPQDNNIEFWRNFVTDFFAPNAKKKWCFSMYGNRNHPTEVPPQNRHDWQCEICNSQLGRGLEANAEILPRLFQMKYENGILEELLHLQDPQEYQNSAGQIIIDYAKATQTSVLNQLRIVREGHLRVVFSPELKICLLEFCARSHDEFIPRTSLIPQISQLKDAAEKHQACAQGQNRPSNKELQNICNEFVESAKQVAKSLEMPSISGFGYPNAYLRFLKTAEVFNSMKDLIDYSIKTGSGPMESLAKFPKRTSTVVEQQQQLQQEQTQQQSMVQNSPNNFSQQQQARHQGRPNLQFFFGLPLIKKNFFAYLNKTSKKHSINFKFFRIFFAFGVGCPVRSDCSQPLRAGSARHY